MSTKVGYAFDEQGHKQVSEATRKVLGGIQHNATPADKKHQIRKFTIGVLLSPLTLAHPAQMQLMRYESALRTFVPISPDEPPETVYGIPGMDKIVWEQGEIVAASFMDGVGWVVSNGAMWAFGHCMEIPNHSVLVLDKAAMPDGGEGYDGYTVESRYLPPDLLIKKKMNGYTVRRPGEHARDDYDVPLWRDTYVFSGVFATDDAESYDSDSDSDDYSNNPAHTTGTGPVPVLRFPPAWVRYDPDAEEPPAVGELWGPIRGETFLVKEPTYRRRVRFKHNVELDIEIGTPDTSPAPADPCHCVVTKAEITIDDFYEDVVFGWVVNAVDEERGLVLIQHNSNLSSTINKRQESAYDFGYDREDDEATPDVDETLREQPDRNYWVHPNQPGEEYDVLPEDSVVGDDPDYEDLGQL